MYVADQFLFVTENAACQMCKLAAGAVHAILVLFTNLRM